MTKSQEKAACCAESASCCRVVSLISIDERGQMVLPKDLRDQIKIKAGDKLALIAWEKDSEISCLILIKADALVNGVKTFLDPMIKDLPSPI